MGPAKLILKWGYKFTKCVLTSTYSQSGGKKRNKSYRVALVDFHRFKSIPSNTFNAVIRNEEGDEKKFFTYEIPKTDIWKENKLEFTVPDGVTKVRIVFYKPQLDPLLPSFFLDDVVILIKP